MNGKELDKQKEEEPLGDIKETPKEEIEINSLQLDSKEIQKPVKLLGEELAPEIISFSDGHIPMRIKDGKIQLDQKALEKERKLLTEDLKNAIKAGNKTLLKIFLQNMPEEDEEFKESRELLKEAFRRKDPYFLQLDALHINLPTEGIAQRNLIREGLRPEIAKQPFTFRDKNGKEIPQEDLDIVFSKGSKKDEYKIIVGSKRGIDSIAFAFEQNFSKEKYRPDMLNADKEITPEALIIPLKPSGEGATPLVSVIEVRRGPVDLPIQLEREEKEKIIEKKIKEENEIKSSYNPPAPKKSSSSYNYVSH